jgi:hypothetical protein
LTESGRMHRVPAANTLLRLTAQRQEHICIFSLGNDLACCPKNGQLTVETI